MGTRLPCGVCGDHTIFIMLFDELQVLFPTGDLLEMPKPRDRRPKRARYGADRGEESAADHSQDDDGH